MAHNIRYATLCLVIGVIGGGDALVAGGTPPSALGWGLVKLPLVHRASKRRITGQ